MPVLLEKIDCPKGRDLLDLEKIYQDFPQPDCWLFIKKQIETGLFQCYAGRFNDRLLGAFVLEEKDSALYIRYLCVRKMTRNRHVAKEMLRQLLLTMQADVFVSNQMPSDALSRLLTDTGFVFDKPKNAWVSKIHVDLNT